MDPVARCMGLLRGETVGTRTLLGMGRAAEWATAPCMAALHKERCSRWIDNGSSWRSCVGRRACSCWGCRLRFMLSRGMSRSERVTAQRECRL